MQDLMITPLCAIRGDIVNKHKKYFRQNFCLRCRKVPGICECIKPQFSNPTPTKKTPKNVEVEDEDK